MKTRKNKSLKNKSRKNKSRKFKLINTRNELCSKNKYTSCCPHQSLTDNKYAATNHHSVLKYNNKKYKLYTCCEFCSIEMNKLSKDNNNKFTKLYVSGYTRKGHLKLKNRNTGKMVQIAKLII